MKKLFLALALLLPLLPMPASAAACSSAWSWSTGTCPDYDDNNMSLLGVNNQFVTDSGSSTVFARTSTESLTAAGLDECVVFGDVDYPCIAAATIENLKALAARPTSKIVVGGTAHNSAFPIAKSATVASGNAVFHLTTNELSGGTAVCANGNVYLDSLQLRAEEGTTPHAFGTPALSNSNKTLTIPVSKIAPILGILNLNQAANGSVIKATVWCD